MTTRPTRAEHEAALARRLQLLGDELAGVRGGPEPPPPRYVQEVADEPVMPTPGRHASRRPRGSLPLVPEAMRGHVALGPGPLAVVAVLVALALGVTTWWVARADPAPVAPLAPTPAGSGSPADLVSPAAPEATAEETGGATVTVDVAGKVRRPGITTLDVGARVVDALKAAGGARRGVNLTDLNLARLLVDGEQIVVGVPVPVPIAGGVASPGAPTGALVNLNTATTVELESLPEVGPVTAEAIQTWREENGGFTAVEELLEVDGIGDTTLEQLAPYVTV